MVSASSDSHTHTHTHGSSRLTDVAMSATRVMSRKTTRQTERERERERDVCEDSELALMSAALRTYVYTCVRAGHLVH